VFLSILSIVINLAYVNQQCCFLDKKSKFGDFLLKSFEIKFFLREILRRRFYCPVPMHFDEQSFGPKLFFVKKFQTFFRQPYLSNLLLSPLSLSLSLSHTHTHTHMQTLPLSLSITHTLIHTYTRSLSHTHIQTQTSTHPRITISLSLFLFLLCNLLHFQSGILFFRFAIVFVRAEKSLLGKLFIFVFFKFRVWSGWVQSSYCGRPNPQLCLISNLAMLLLFLLLLLLLLLL